MLLQTVALPSTLHQFGVRPSSPFKGNICRKWKVKFNTLAFSANKFTLAILIIVCVPRFSRGFDSGMIQWARLCNGRAGQQRKLRKPIIDGFHTNTKRSGMMLRKTVRLWPLLLCTLYCSVHYSTALRGQTLGKCNNNSNIALPKLVSMS